MFIYKITNTINGKIYIGQTTRSIIERWHQHKALRKDMHISAIKSAIHKYGESHFTIEQIDTAIDINALNKKRNILD